MRVSRRLACGVRRPAEHGFPAGSQKLHARTRRSESRFASTPSRLRLDDVNEHLRLQLPVRTLFSAPTIARLASEIRDALAKQSPPVTYPPLVPLRPGGTNAPFFLVAGGFGGEAELLVYAKLAPFPAGSACLRPASARSG
jgi:hypothetical protein